MKQFDISILKFHYLIIHIYECDSTLLLALLYPELNQLFSHLFVPSRWLVSMRPPNGQKQPQILGKNNQPQKMLPNLIINSLFCKLFSKTKNASQMIYIMIKFTNVAINLFMTFMPISFRRYVWNYFVWFVSHILQIALQILHQYPSSILIMI